MKQSKQSLKNESISLLYWVLHNGIKNEKGDLIEFDKHRFLLDIYSDRSKEIVIRKSSQVGASTYAILKEIHDMKFWGINQIHTLPSDRDVWEFVPTKVDKILRENGIKLDKDSGEIKGVGKGFVYYKGTFTEKAPIIISSDRNIYDEVDKSRIEVIGDYASRMSASKMGEEVYISTPTIPDFGIDKLYSQSDQKHWRFKCPHCEFKQHMEWEDNIDFEKETYVCQECRKELTLDDINKGEWEAKFDREISGYFINQMMWWSAPRIIKEHREAMAGDKGKDEQYFYNFVLGLPYLSADKKIEASLFLKNIVKSEPEGENVCGIDIGKGSGKGSHIVIGNKSGVFWIKELKDEMVDGKLVDVWEQIGELIEFYDIRTGVVDGAYETEKCQRLAEKFPYKIFLAFYKNDPKMLEVFRFGDEQEKEMEFEEEIKVIASRNRIMDDVISALKRGEIRFALPQDSVMFKLLIKHSQNMYARNVEDRYGQMHREWASLGADDLWHALVYWYLAFKKQLKYEPNK